MKALTLHNLARSFGGLPAVDGLSLTAQPGRITGLIGPNGAGKTTVVNLITGLLKVTSGTITLGETDVTEASAQDLARAGVARTFQNIRLIADYSVLDNVIAGFHRHETVSTLGNILGVPAVFRERRQLADKAYQLLEQFDMTTLAHHPAGSLSYGHQRRIEMMRALAMDPAVLLLDEPVAGMNDIEAHSLAEIFRAVAARGVSILLIEHNMRFVLSLCAHVYVLNSGRLIAEGSPEEVIQDPIVVEAYLGS